MTRADRTVTGTVFSIQKFSLHDGPGIRTTVFMKGCPLRCRWCSNPESQLASVEIMHDSSVCLHCGTCIAVCPAHAVSSKSGQIHIDHHLCTGCLQCVRECPEHALTPEGEKKSVQDVLKAVRQDLPFYEESGGGITLSGGEFLMQPEFSENLLKACREDGIDTCCETTGFAPVALFRRFLPLLDHVLIDVKHWNSRSHCDGTGVSSGLPLACLREAAASHQDVLPRIPVIPGFNSSPEDALHFAELLKEAGVSRVQLLPFHQLGEKKYDQLGRSYSYRSFQPLHPEDLEDYRKVFLQEGVDAFF